MYDQIYANAVELDPYFDANVRVHYDRLPIILEAVRYDNPDLFWLSHVIHYTYDGNGNVTSVTLEFYDEMVQNLRAYKELFYDCADSVLEYAMTLDDDVRRVKFVHDLLTNINTYEFNEWDQSAYSALCTGKTVCAGYSYAFQYFMQRLGIPSMVVVGYAGERHAWNMVYLYGDYYEMDVTWNDPVGNPPTTYYYNYFNITTRQMGNRTRRDSSESFPMANGTAYSYNNFFGNRPGSDFSGIDYGNPRTSLPPVYPGRQQQTPVWWSPGDDEDDDALDDYLYEYDLEDLFFGDLGVTWSFDEVEEWLIETDDDEWSELWEFFEEFFDEDELEYLYESDWYEFVEFLEEMLN
jgi:hypothetical protein